MELKKYLEAYHEFSGKASDIARQLAFAAIAIIWIFKTNSIEIIAIPNELIRPSALIIMALAFDLLQYVIASIIWKIFYSLKERKGVPVDQDVKASPWLSRIVLFFFIFKILFVIVGYILIFKFILSKI